MIGTQLLKGQGLGNQLFCYVTARCIAKERGEEFAILGGDTLANNIHSDCGLYFMDLDLGRKARKEDFGRVYREKEDRLFLGNSRHDLQHGVYIAKTDEGMYHVPEDTLLMGNMQSEEYFIKYREEIKEWLKVKPEYECYEYSRENLCILHLRCSDYMDCPELFLHKSYWQKGMENMRKLNPGMEFMIITNDVKEAGKILPGIPAYNFDLAKDYSILKNARYLLLANSSFTYFPAFTSDTVQYIIAPKYWARHNVSDGYWSSEQNIYTGFHYQDRRGRLFTAQECREELRRYKETSPKYQRLNQRPEGVLRFAMEWESKTRYSWYRLQRIVRSVKRRLRLAVQGSA